VRNRLGRLGEPLLSTRPTAVAPRPCQTNSLSNLRIIPPERPLFRMHCRIQLALYPRTYALETRTLTLRSVRPIVAQLG
jgi:hypothetical protein